MFSENGTPTESLEAFQERLIGNYREIEERAIRTIRQGETVDNPILTGERLDERYSVTTVGLLTGPAEEFLHTVQMQLQAIEPLIHLVPREFLHITLRELSFNLLGRKAGRVDAVAARAYYQALRKRFAEPGKPPLSISYLKLLQ